MVAPVKQRYSDSFSAAWLSRSVHGAEWRSLSLMFAFAFSSQDPGRSWGAYFPKLP